MSRILRAAVVGASSLQGKELAEELSASKAAVWDVTLLDTGESQGIVTAAGDEAAVIQPVAAESFAGVDVAFFTGDPATARERWTMAQQAGASIVDLTGALERVPGVLVRCPWVNGGTKSDLATVGVVAAHPAAVMLAVVSQRLQRRFGPVKLAATVMEPASQMGGPGLDELHQQTVALLSFQAVPKDVYDAQVAFNLRSALGGAAKTDLSVTAETIRRQFAALVAGEKIAVPAIQLVQAPVFHGYTASIFVTLQGADESAVRQALAGGIADVGESSTPSNESVAGLGEIQIEVSAEQTGEGFWLWMAADNLRLAARNSVACAAELAALRPAGGLH